MRDFHNNAKAEVALNTSAISSNTTTAGAIIDLQGYGAVEFVIQSATLTDGTYTPLIEDGAAANLSDAATVSAANLLGTIAGATFALTDDNSVKKIGYVGNKRYVRLSIVSTSVTTGGTVSAVSVKTRAVDKPVS